MIWSSVRRVGGGAIITPAAPASIDLRANERIAAKPGAETPTMICRFFARLTKRVATASASERFQLRRLAHDAEHGDAVAADLGIEIGEPVDGFVVDAAIVVERRRRDRKGACGLVGEFHGQSLF